MRATITQRRHGRRLVVMVMMVVMMMMVVAIVTGIGGINQAASIRAISLSISM